MALALASLGRRAARAEKGQMTTYTLSIIVEGQDKASGPLSGISNALSHMGQIAGGILAADIFRGLGQSIVSFGSQAIKATAQMQAFEMGLQTLMTRELRTADSTLSMNDAFDQAGPLAANMAAQLKDIAIQSPYKLGTVQDTFRLAMAFGFASDEAKKFTNGILNMAAGVGASDEMMGRMAYNLAQIRMQGKVTAMDVRQLAMAGFDLNGALVDIGAQFGVTIKDFKGFNDAVASGKIKWSDFAGAFEKYANENFGGAAERMSRTFQGLQSTFSDFFLLTMPAILGPGLQVVTDWANAILNVFIKLANSGALEKWGQSIGDAMSDFFKVDKLKAVFSTWESSTLDTRAKMLNTVRLLFGKDMAQAVNGLLPSSAKLDAIFSTWTSSTMDFKSKLLNTFRLMFGAEALRAVISGAQSIGQTLDNIFMPIRIALKLAFLEIRSAVTQALYDMQSGFASFATFITTYGPGIATTITTAFGAIITFGSQLIAQVLPFLVEQFNKLGAWFVTNGPLISANVAQWGVIFQGFLTVLGGAWSVIAPLLSGIVDLVLNLATFWMQVFTLDLPGAMNTFQIMATGILATVSAVILAFANWVTSWFGTTWAQVWALTVSNWNMMLALITSVAQRIVASVTAMASAVVMYIGTAWSQAWASTVRDWNMMISIIVTATQKIVAAVTAMSSNVVAYMGTMLTKAVSALKSGASLMAAAGASMLQGLFDGIKKKSSEILKYVKDLAKQIADAFAKVMAIKSPSRVFAGFGENMMAGLKNGISDGAGQALDATQRAGSQINDSFPTSYSSVGGAGSRAAAPVTFYVDGSKDPEETARAIYKLLKAQGLVAE